MTKSASQFDSRDESLADKLIWNKEFELSLEMPFEECVNQLHYAEANGIILTLQSVKPTITSTDNSSISFAISIGQKIPLTLTASLERSTDETTLFCGKAGYDIQVIIWFIGLIGLLVFGATYFSKSFVAGITAVSIAGAVNLAVYLGLKYSRNNLLSQTIKIFRSYEADNNT